MGDKWWIDNHKVGGRDYCAADRHRFLLSLSLTHARTETHTHTRLPVELRHSEGQRNNGFETLPSLLHSRICYGMEKQPWQNVFFPQLPCNQIVSLTVSVQVTRFAIEILLQQVSVETGFQNEQGLIK